MKGREFTEDQKRRFDKLHERFVEKLRAGEVWIFPESVFDALRPYHFGGLPLSIMLFMPEMCNGNAYDRSAFMTLAFEECNQIYLDIETLRIRTRGDKSKGRAGHAVVEAYGYIFDNSLGLMYTKDAYWYIEKPRVTKTHTKQECLDYLETQEILSGDFNNDKWSLIPTLPSLEKAIENSKYPSTDCNKNFLLNEIKKLKEAIGFDEMLAEQENDMKLLRTNPGALEEKFQIVRDKHGREMSRGGVPNPYYKEFDPSKVEERNAQFAEDMKDPKKKMAFWRKSASKRLAETRITKRKAKAFMKKVLKNRTANVYEEILSSKQSEK